MLTTLGTISLVLASLGGVPSRAAGCCDVCGIETAEVIAEIQKLQTCPNWRGREDAAHDLREFDWRCHPIVVDALAGALIGDCDDRVRKEAAQSLKKIGACTPTAHSALKRAADCDPKFCNRFWARRALATIRRKCDGDCTVCKAGPAIPSYAVPIGPAPMYVPGEPGLTPTVVSPEILIDPGMTPLVPAPESPPPPPQPDRSPFVEPLPGSGPPLDGPFREARRIDEKPVKKVVEKKPEPKDDPPSRRTRPAGLLSGLRSRVSGR